MNTNLSDFSATLAVSSSLCCGRSGRFFFRRNFLGGNNTAEGETKGVRVRKSVVVAVVVKESGSEIVKRFDIEIFKNVLMDKENKRDEGCFRALDRN